MPVSDVYVMHDRLKAGYQKLSELDGQYQKVRTEMDQLVKLGDMVEPDDVVKAAGRLVGHGLGAEAIAEIVASMPPNGGQPLAAWVQAQDARFTQMELQMNQMKRGVQHQMGVAALRVMAAEHVRTTPLPQMGSSPAAAPPQANALTVNQPSAPSAPANGLMQ